MNVDELKRYVATQVPILLGEAWNKVSALAFQGGLGRGTFDRLSDIDLLVAFDQEEDSVGVIRGEQVIDGMQWSIFHLTMGKVSPKKWNDKLRYIYGYETMPFYDPNGSLKQICEASLLSEEEKMERVVYHIKKMGNCGITYRGISSQEWRGIYWGDSYDKWVVRGDPYAAQMRLNQAIELLIHLVFSINGQPVPSSKWKHHLVAKLEWVPRNFTEGLYESSLIHAYSKEDIDRRYQLLIELTTQCVDKSIEMGMLPPNMGDYYYPKFSRHNDSNENGT